MLSSTWQSACRLKPSTLLGHKAIATIRRITPSISVKANQISKPLSLVWSCTASYSILSLRHTTSPLLYRSYYTSNTIKSSQASSVPTQLSLIYEQKCEELSASLRATGVNYSVELDKLRDLLKNTTDKSLEPIVSKLVRLWLSSEIEIPVVDRTLALEAATAYYYELETLLAMETMIFAARSNCEVKPSINTYLKLLSLSGRHRQRPSIEMALKMWKKDYGLSYEIDNEELQASLMDQEQLLSSALPTARMDRNLASKNFFDYIKNEKQEKDVLELFKATMKAALRSKHLELSEMVFQEALMVIKDSQSLYDTMVEIYCDANRVEKAHKLLFVMDKKEKGVLVTLDACARLMNFHLAEKIFYDSQSAFKLVPTADTWNSLLNVYVIRKEMNVAHDRFIDLLQSKHKTRPNLKTYEQMITGHVRAKDVQRAEEMYKHAISNKIDISVHIYSWMVEAFVNAKNFDGAFGIVQAMQERELVLPHKFKHLLLQRCRRHDGMLERYEKFFGSAPEPFDDLKELRMHAEMKREHEKSVAEENKLRKKAAKQSAIGVSTSETTSSEFMDVNPEDLTGELSIEEALKAEGIEEDNTQFVDVIEPHQGGEYGYLEEVVEDDAEVSMEEWMKDDMGEHGWMDFSKPDTSSSKKYKRIHNMTERFQDVFEVAGWNDPLDVTGKVKPKEWQILSDPFSKMSPEVAAKQRENRRVDAQIDALQAEVIEKIEAETERSKLRQQRRRERAYGQTRRYVDDPKKIRKEKEERNRHRGPPPGSSFSFR